MVPMTNQVLEQTFRAPVDPKDKREPHTVGVKV